MSLVRAGRGGREVADRLHAGQVRRRHREGAVGSGHPVLDDQPHRGRPAARQLHRDLLPLARGEPSDGRRRDGLGLDRRRSRRPSRTGRRPAGGPGRCRRSGRPGGSGAPGVSGSMAGSGNQPVVSVPRPVTPGGRIVGSAPGTCSTSSCHTGSGVRRRERRGVAGGEGEVAGAGVGRRGCADVGRPSAPSPRRPRRARTHGPSRACIWLPATLQPGACHTGASTITPISSPTRTVVAVTSTARSGVTPYVRVFGAAAPPQPAGGDRRDEQPPPDVAQVELVPVRRELLEVEHRDLGVEVVAEGLAAVAVGLPDVGPGEAEHGRPADEQRRTPR